MQDEVTDQAFVTTLEIIHSHTTSLSRGVKKHKTSYFRNSFTQPEVSFLGGGNHKLKLGQMFAYTFKILFTSTAEGKLCDVHPVSSSLFLLV